MSDSVATDRIEADFASLPGDAGLALLVLDPQGREVLRHDLSRGREAFPLGSVFKLYVLAELARQVAAGRVAPGSELPIRDELKSLPTGEMQTLARGTRVSIRTMAQEMIAISDNTATDHLIDLLDRERIERHLVEYMNSEPERNTPFLYSREMFLVKGAGARPLRAVFGTASIREIAALWVAAGTRERRSWLRALTERMPDLSFESLQDLLAKGYRVTSFHPEHAEIEWVARPRDIVNLLHAAHEERLVSPEASRFFLDVFQQGAIFYESPTVREHGFKGGRERGVNCYALRVVFEGGHTLFACLCIAGLSIAEMRDVDDAGELLRSWIDDLAEMGGDSP